LEDPSSPQQCGRLDDPKKETDCLPVSDWSSPGTKAAIAKSVADELFSWAARPWGAQEMNTYVDAAYCDYLGKQP